MLFRSLKKELKHAKEELRACGYSKPQFLIDDDGEYQDQLEIGWAKAEIRERIELIEQEIAEMEGE